MAAMVPFGQHCPGFGAACFRADLRESAKLRNVGAMPRQAAELMQGKAFEPRAGWTAMTIWCDSAC
jgi:hypothetical protein